MTEQSENKELLYKILLLGDSSVGKTCFLMRYSDNTFQEIHMSTIGLDYKLKNVQLDDGNIVKIQIWDTAGQDRFRSITKNYYKGAHGIILIYDITSRKTYENIKNWVTQIKEEVSDKVNIILVGNKIDDEKNRKVSTEEGEKMAKEIGFDFYETSAKTGINIDSTFNDLVKKTVESFSKTNVKGDKLNTKKAGSKRGCC
jgi:small GTP-binding protein